jgi:hypothetical protein
VSTATRERKPRGKRLVFIGLCLLVCLGSLRTWCNVGAKGWVWQVEKSATFAHLGKGVSRFALSMSK